MIIFSRGKRKVKAEKKVKILLILVETGKENVEKSVTSGSVDFVFGLRLKSFLVFLCHRQHLCQHYKGFQAALTLIHCHNSRLDDSPKNMAHFAKMNSVLHSIQINMKL